MTRRKRLVFLALIALILLLIIIWILYVLFSKPEPEPVVIEPVAEEIVLPVEEVVEREPTVTEKASAQEQATRTQSADVISLSKTFVERYGSYSNEADFANLRDVLLLMTDDLAEDTERFIEDNTAPEQYYGVTTKVITVTVESQDDDAGTAQVLVNTQREESDNNPQNISVKYQEIRLNYVKESGGWKVDSANWL